MTDVTQCVPGAPFAGTVDAGKPGRQAAPQRCRNQLAPLWYGICRSLSSPYISPDESVSP